jgi:ankyrin repeat protein
MGQHEHRQEFFDAVIGRDLERTRALGEADPEVVDAPNPHGNTPLSHAVGSLNAPMVTLLLALGADANQRKHDGKGLLERVNPAGLEISRILVAAGCEIAPRHAVALGDAKAVRAALDARPKLVNEVVLPRRRLTLLHVAAAARAVETATLLLDRGADVNAETREGHRPISLTAAEPRGGGVEMARLLLSHGAKVDVPAGYSGGTVLHRALALRDEKLARLLLKAGASPKARDSTQKTPLHEAVLTGSQKLVKLVLKFRPDLEARTGSRRGVDGLTALDQARQRKLPHIVALLEAAQG